MRILFLTLIFAIGFSGFSSAVEAFDSSKCKEILPVEKTAGIQHDCGNHLKAQSKDDQKSKDANHSCINCGNCGNCCMSHVALIQFGVSIAIPVKKTAFSHVNAEPDDDFISGLKRPPRILI